MNEYAYYGKGHTIHYSGQIEWHKNTVDDKSVKVGGSQCITTLDEFALKFNVIDDSRGYEDIIDEPRPPPPDKRKTLKYFQEMMQRIKRQKRKVGSQNGQQKRL